jgi:Domain of unknown function (DUF4412)
MRLILLLLLSAAFARADLIVKQTVENAGQTQSVVLKIKDQLCRVESTPQSSAIIDGRTGETTVLIHPQKAYMKISGEQLRAQTQALKNMLGNKDQSSGEPSFTPTGKSEKINNYDTEEYSASLNGIQMLVACDKTFPNYQGIVKAMYSVQSGPGMELLRGLTVAPEKYPGMPIRTVIEILGQRITTTLDSIQETTVAESEFAVPSDYKEINPPSQPGEPTKPSTQ